MTINGELPNKFRILFCKEIDMYTTKQAIKILLNKPLGLTFIMESNPNIHIFKCIDGTICKGEYGSGHIITIDHNSFPNEIWLIDFKGSKFRE